MPYTLTHTGAEVDEAVGLVLEKFQDINISVVSDRLTSLSYTARYYPQLDMCFCRIYGRLSGVFYAGSDYNILNITGHAPSSRHALAVTCLKNIQAFTTGTGYINIRPLENSDASYDIYISGWWVPAS